MTMVLTFCGLIAVEVYYWFIWLPKNKHTLREYKDYKCYQHNIWKKGYGIK